MPMQFAKKKIEDRKTIAGNTEQKKDSWYKVNRYKFGYWPPQFFVV